MTISKNNQAGEKQQPLLDVKGLVKYFPVLQKGVIRTRRVGWVHACDNVSFDLTEGETMGLVGESGCGKTTVARSILHLVPPTSGKIRFEGRDISGVFDSKDKYKILALRRKIQLVFQNPYTAINPRMTVKDIVSESFAIYNHVPKGKRKERTLQLLDMVGLEPYHANRYPHEFSGGKRQRIGIARVLAVDPKIVFLDEPVSSLDVSVRSQILKLLLRLQQRMKLTYLYISHDLNSVMLMSSRVAVMYLGELVEVADTETIFKRCIHPYTQALLSAIPKIDPQTHKKKIILSGEVPSSVNPPTGCRFHPRCPYATDRCKKEKPKLVEIKKHHSVRCHLVS